MENKYTEGLLVAFCGSSACIGCSSDGEACEDFKEFKKKLEAKNRLEAAAPQLLEACKGARKLYDEMARGPLGNAAKFGPDFEPMSDEDILEIRKAIEAAIAAAEAEE